MEMHIAEREKKRQGGVQVHEQGHGEIAFLKARCELRLDLASLGGD